MDFQKCFLWAATLHAPLLKYKIIRQRGKHFIEATTILNRAGHCRLTIPCLKNNPTKAYEICYSGAIHI